MREPTGICLAAQAVGVAAAVPALVARSHEPADLGHREVRRQESLADDRVKTDEVPLGGAQLMLLAEDLARERHVADVTEVRRGCEVVEPIGRQPHALADIGRELGDVEP